MKGLRKYLSPFTPDQSGAVSVLFGYGGMLIILDAGGCVGNTCGYDEPRWTGSKSAVFSAGLRDLDAILGRDDLLIKKTGKALKDIDANFIGLIGTPVPAVIGTDYRALKRLMEKDYGLPVVPVETDGMELYDRGQEKAYMSLFGEFASDDPGESADVGIIGCTPLDTMTVGDESELLEVLRIRGHESAVCYGCGDSLEAVRNAGSVKTNLVMSPSGLKPARYLQERFGTPYEVGYPIDHRRNRAMADKIGSYDAESVLVVHQQVFANEIRRIAGVLCGIERADVATWFMLDDEIKEDGDVRLEEEDDLLKLVEERGYDMVIGDPLLKRALPGWKGVFLSLPHFAVSGKLHESGSVEEYWQKAGEKVE
jgi:hypothetical protein